MTHGRPPVVVPPPRPMRCLACKLSNRRKSFTESKIYPQMKLKCLFRYMYSMILSRLAIIYILLRYLDIWCSEHDVPKLLFHRLTVEFTISSCISYWKRVMFQPYLPWQGMALHMPPVNGGMWVIWFQQLRGWKSGIFWNFRNCLAGKGCVSFSHHE